MVPFNKIFGRLGNSMFQGAYIYAQMKRGQIPDIFVQDPKYFNEYREEIRRLFGQGISSVDKVAIHVRRAKNPIDPDEPAYSDNPFYVDLTKTHYYPEAMSCFQNEQFIVFSDDIEWCKLQPVFKNCEFSEGKTEVEDMNLMASCKGIIMANSSFSWWASWLSNAKVIAPLEWYSDGIERTKLLPEWTKI